jgi:hypothetical protein
VTSARLLAALFLLLLAGPSLAQEEVQAYVKGFSCNSGPYKLKLPPTYRALRALGQVKREKTLRVEQTPEGKTELRSLRFKSLEFVVLVDSRKPNAYQVLTVTFSSPNWRIAGPLRVGAPAAAALKGMGLESVPRDAELEIEGDTDSVLLTILAGRVQQVEYDCSGE